MDSVFHAKYLSEKLMLRKFGNSADRISQTLFNSRISLNPHQIDAALFAFKSPMSKGIVLADEVGLGKTIEAGVVISQYWCERKRKILIICPASLARQWQSELMDKFNLNSEILDNRTFSDYEKRGYINPFGIKEKISICSINYASRKKDFIQTAGLDLVILDEAHKLRNAHNPNSIMANNIKESIKDYKKILLTATPFQNNLLELYGLSMIINEDIFGDKELFRHSYIKNYDENKLDLRNRLSQFVQRTLRDQVKQYVKYPKRITHTFRFEQTEQEEMLYDKITELIQREDSLALGKGQRQLVALILRKLLSSSSEAVIGTLVSIKARLESILEVNSEAALDLKSLTEELNMVEEIEDELLEDYEGKDAAYIKVGSKQLQKEIQELDSYINIARSIGTDSKAYKLLEALDFSFKHLSNLKIDGKKIIIFTESRRTQDYLYNFLKSNGYSKTIRYNGVNNTEEANEIYENWCKDPKNQGYLKNSKAINIRLALIEYFRDEAEIMIATEAGAEGLNLQFCSLLINYDLPWNPQRVEQRIGRCHRYGQKYDVVVINFLNESNKIDSRVYQLLNEKFSLFDDVFGSTDEVLGIIDDGKDIEKRIFEIYQNCRTPKEIDEAFDKLQEMFKTDIDEKMKETRKLLLENFDEDIQKKFDITLEQVEQNIKEFERDFWRLTKFELKDYADFEDENYIFTLKKRFEAADAGKYRLVSSSEGGEYRSYSMNDYFGESIVNTSLNRDVNSGIIKFDLSNYIYKISELEELRGKTGYLVLGKLSISSYEEEEFLLFNARMDSGELLDQEACEKLFRLGVLSAESIALEDNSIIQVLNKDLEQHMQAIVNSSSSRNTDIFNKESQRINQWANDKVNSIQLKVEILRERRKELQKLSDYSINTQEKDSYEEEITKISKQVSSLWLQLAAAEEEVEAQRRALINNLKKERMKTVKKKTLFKIKFEIC